MKSSQSSRTLHMGQSLFKETRVMSARSSSIADAGVHQGGKGILVPGCRGEPWPSWLPLTSGSEQTYTMPGEGQKAPVQALTGPMGGTDT